MPDENIVIIVGLVIFLVVDYGLFALEYRRLERQHIRHKAELDELFSKYLG